MRETDLIAKLAAKLSGKHPLLIQGIGDDAAVWDWDPDHYGLISTDILHELWDFDRVYHPAKYIGYKAAASALSDICAMNGKPLFLTIGLGLPRHFPPQEVEALYEGLHKIEENYQVAVIGGDISLASHLWLSVTVVGKVRKDRIAYRLSLIHI